MKKMFRRIRRTTTGQLVVYFVDENGKEIDPNQIGNYTEVSDESPSFGETAPTTTSNTQTGGTTSTQSSVDTSRGSETSTDAYSSTGTSVGTMENGLFGFVDKLFEKLGIDLSDDNPPANDPKFAAGAVAKSIPVMGSAVAADPSSFPENNRPTFTQNAKDGQIMQWMMEAGAQPSMAQNLMQVMTEVSGLDPNFNQSSAVLDLNTNSYPTKVGLLAWEGDRLNKLNQFAASKGTNPIDATTQAQFAVEEGKPESPYANPGTVEAFQYFADNPSVDYETLQQVIRDKVIGNATGTPTAQPTSNVKPQFAPSVPVSETAPVASKPAQATTLAEMAGTGSVAPSAPQQTASNFAPSTAPITVDVNSGPVYDSMVSGLENQDGIDYSKIDFNDMFGTPSTSGFAPNTKAPTPASEAEFEAPKPNGTIKADTALVRPTGETRPATLRDSNATVPEDYRPSVMDSIEPGNILKDYLDKGQAATTQIPTDKYGLPAGKNAGTDLATNPTGVILENPFGMPFAPQWDATPAMKQNDTTDWTTPWPEGTTWKDEYKVQPSGSYGPPFGTLAPGPREESISDLGIGESWVPKAPTGTPAPNLTDFVRERTPDMVPAVQAELPNVATNSRSTKSSFAPADKNVQTSGGNRMETSSSGGMRDPRESSTTSSKSYDSEKDTQGSFAPSPKPTSTPQQPKSVDSYKESSKNSSSGGDRPSSSGGPTTKTSSGPTGGPTRGNSGNAGGFMDVKPVTVPAKTLPGQPMKSNSWAPWS